MLRPVRLAEGEGMKHIPPEPVGNVDDYAAKRISACIVQLAVEDFEACVNAGKINADGTRNTNPKAWHMKNSRGRLIRWNVNNAYKTEREVDGLIASFGYDGPISRLLKRAELGVSIESVRRKLGIAMQGDAI